MNKVLKITISILLTINILAIVFFSCFAYYGKLYEEYIYSSITGGTSLNGIDTNVSFVDLLKLRFTPEKFDMTQINRTAILSLSNDNSYTNHEYTVTIYNRGQRDTGYWAEILVEEDNKISHGSIITYYDDTQYAEYEFYLKPFGENELMVYIKDGEEWKKINVPLMSGDYHISNIIKLLPNFEFSSFPLKSTGQDWSFKPVNSFIRSVLTWQDGRIFEITANFPSGAGNRLLFNFVSPSGPENLEFIYMERGNCGNVKIDFPDFESQNLEMIPSDIFEKYK